MKKRKNLGCNYGSRMMVMVAVFFIDGGVDSFWCLPHCIATYYRQIAAEDGACVSDIRMQDRDVSDTSVTAYHC